jgi:hypothetical protein
MESGNGAFACPFGFGRGGVPSALKNASISPRKASSSRGRLIAGGLVGVFFFTVKGDLRVRYGFQRFVDMLE